MILDKINNALQQLGEPLRLIASMLIPLAAFVLQWIFWDAIQPYVWFLFYPAVFFSSWIGGKKAGLSATALSTLIVWWFFIPPRYTFSLERPVGAIAITIFAGMGVLFSFTFERLRKARQELADALVVVSAAKNQSEKALRENSSLLRVAGRVALFGGWSVNAADGTVTWSDEVAHIHDEQPGYSPALTDGINYYAPEWREKITAVFGDCMQHGTPFDEEMQIITARGRRVWVRTIGEAERNAHGEILRVNGAFQDITERKQAEAARQKFVMLADSSSEFIGMCDFDFKPLYVNPAGVRMVGLPDMATACQVKVQDYFFPEDQRFITEEFFPRVLREGNGDVEIRLRHFQTGEPIWMFYYLYCVRDASDQIVGWATVSRDITERKKAELKLMDALADAQRFREALDNAPSYIYMKDTQSRYVYANRPTLELFGCTAGELAGCDDTRFFPPDTVEHLLEVDARVLAGEQTTEEIEVVDAEGRLCIYQEIKTPIYEQPESKTIWGLLGISTDITKRKEAEKLLRENRAILDAALASMTDAVFISNAAGEFIEFNDAFATFHKFRNKDECARKLSDYPDIVDVFMADGEPAPLDMWAVPRALRGETVTNAEYSLRRKDTGETWIGSYSFSPIRDNNSVIVGSVVVGRDITALNSTLLYYK